MPTKPEGPAQERMEKILDQLASEPASPRQRPVVPPVPATPAPSQPAAHTEPHGAFFQPHVIPKVKGCPDCEAMAKRVTVLGQTRPENVGLTPLMEACDREWSDETPEQVIAIAANAIYWRNREIQKLREHNAPSQPAGAREWPCPSHARDCSAGGCKVCSAIAALLAQQTAAKDAEIERLKRDLEERSHGYSIRAKFLSEQFQAAERERDSLREALVGVMPQVQPCASAYCEEHGHTDCPFGVAVAALKAGKEGQL